MCVWILSANFVWNIFHSKKSSENCAQKCVFMFMSGTVILVRFLLKLEFSRQTFRKKVISNFMKIRSVGAEFYANGRTDRQTGGRTWQSWWLLFAILRMRLTMTDDFCGHSNSSSSSSNNNDNNSKCDIEIGTYSFGLLGRCYDFNHVCWRKWKIRETSDLWLPGLSLNQCFSTFVRPRPGKLFWCRITSLCSGGLYGKSVTSA